MAEISVHDFHREMDCIYDSEKYSVRDNGAVLRHPQIGKRPRPTDNQWTFGKPNMQNGYMHISQTRIHRIVATAFHGEPLTPEHVVDHIDTNRQNNRPENLRWLTRLENALLNPITAKRIEFICGSIDAFLADPSILSNSRLDRNFEWMRTVTPEEAKNCKLRLSILTNSVKKTEKSVSVINQKSVFKERIYKPLRKWEVGLGREPGLEMALTPWCAQYMWRASPYFPCCPDNFGTDPIQDYFQNLKSESVLAYSDDSEDICPKLIIYEAKILIQKSSILVICKRIDSKWSIVGIVLDKKSKHFIHFILGSYSSKDEAYKQFYSKNELTNFWSEGYSNIYQ